MTATSDFLFSFLLFFQVQMDSIHESGFYKLLEEKYPEVANASKQAQSDPQLQKFIKLTGLEFDNLNSFSLTVEGLEAMANAKAIGITPRLGSEIEFLLSSEIEGELDAAALFQFFLEQLEKEEGVEVRKQVEATKKKMGETTVMTVPAEVMGEEASTSDLLLAVKKLENQSLVILGVPKSVNQALAGKPKDLSMASMEAMAQARQVTFALELDPAIWDRPEFGANPQNPLFAGLAESVKGIQEVGFSLTFMEESLGVEICVHCKDTQSALGLWTVAQGGLGMAQLAMAQKGPNSPAILGRIKTQAVDKNVFVRVEMLMEDFDEFKAMMSPQVQPLSTAKDPMVGKNAKPIQSKLLNGEDFKLADHKGKVVILDFWATWCGPCVQALPELLQATSSFNDDQVKLIAVNQGEAKKVISKFLASKQLESLEVALDRNRKIGSDYGVQGIPRTVVIDPKGVIREVHVGYAPGMGERLRLEIENLLAE